jgi:transmembrane sensor
MSRTEPIEDTIASTAAEWYVAHRAGELEGTAREAFMQWLRASPLHVAEYLAISGIARDLPGATRRSQLPEEALKEPFSESARVESLTAHQPAKQRRYGTLALAAGMALLTLTAFLVWSALRGHNFSTSHGEQRTVQLPDMSLVRLNSDSRVRLNFEGAERTVTLLRGEVYFDVAKDPVRPFRVRVGDIVLTALGTAFDVYARPNGTTVTVTEGRVGIGEKLIPVAAGGEARISANGDVKIVRKSDVPRATAWVHQEIAFEREPIAEVAAEFNRYNRIEIEVDGGAVGATPISGVFHSYDVQSFLDFLDQLLNVKVVRDGKSARVVPK